MIPAEAARAAEGTYRETLTELRLNERGAFKSGSHHRRALHAALEAAGSIHLTELQKAREALGRVAKVRQELFDVSNNEDFRPQARAAYRDASRAIYIALLEVE